MRFGILDQADLPRGEIELLGPTGAKRIDTLVHDLVETSEAAGDIRQSDEVGEAMLSLRAFMFDRVYLGPQVEPEHRRARDVIRRVFDHVIGRGDPLDDAVDYVAGMTDRFALTFAEAIG
jgi:dGTPase